MPKLWFTLIIKEQRNINHSEMPVPCIWMLKWKEPTIPGLAKMWRNETFYTAGGNIECYIHIEKQVHSF